MGPNSDHMSFQFEPGHLPHHSDHMMGTQEGLTRSQDEGVLGRNDWGGDCNGSNWLLVPSKARSAPFGSRPFSLRS